MPDRAYLHPIDPELVPGARNAIDVCLRLKPQERITIMSDTATREIAAALQKEVERVGSEYSLFVLEQPRDAERITCRTSHGTEFEAELSPKLKWLKTSGIITRDKWGNLPGGEIFTSPMNTKGVFVVDGVVGDYLCERFGDLKPNPL